jgi:hypothetical protein
VCSKILYETDIEVTTIFSHKISALPSHVYYQMHITFHRVVKHHTDSRCKMHATDETGLSFNSIYNNCRIVSAVSK